MNPFALIFHPVTQFEWKFQIPP